MLTQGVTLVIDDKVEDGHPISEQLRNLFIPHLFFHADEKVLLDYLQSSKAKIENIRVIFQDINLTAGASPSTKDYDKAVSIIEALMEEQNGPWLLVTWSTWSAEGDDTYGKELYEHLVKELTPSQRPYNFVSLDKSLFTASQHGDVSSYSEMDCETRESFAHKINASLLQSKAISTLLNWEKSIRQATSKTLADLHSLSTDGGNSDELKLGKLLYELAKAEMGKSLNNENSLLALSNILNCQMFDRIQSQLDVDIDITSYKDVHNWADVKAWKKQVNKILHFSTQQGVTGPGTIYTYASYLEGSTLCYSNNEGLATNISIIGEDNIKATYIKMVEEADMEKEEHRPDLLERINNATCIITDITPPCDHAQNKALWLKFCGGLFVNLNGLSNPKIRSFNKIFSTPEYLWNSCDFALEQSELKHNRLIFNSRFIFTCADDTSIKEKLTLATTTKMKEQITRDLIHWLGKQLTRPGYTYM
jgi:hypothetical protein